MSARAAWRLESLGFAQVYRYTAGKVDWMATGLPIEGTMASLPRVGSLARRDVPTCRLDERVADVCNRVRASRWELCVVVNERNVVLGRLKCETPNADPDALAGDVMEPGPVTYRPHEVAADAAQKLAERHVKNVLVTTADGELIGVFCPEDAPGDGRTSGSGDEG